MKSPWPSPPARHPALPPPLLPRHRRPRGDMKGYATFFLIAVMSLGLVFLLVTRSRTPHDAPLADPEIVEATDAGDGGKGDGGAFGNDAASLVDDTATTE